MDRIKQFEEEAKKKWGTTPQYSEYMDNNKNKTSEQMAEIGKEFMEIFAKCRELKKYGVDSFEVQQNDFHPHKQYHNSDKKDMPCYIRNFLRIKPYFPDERMPAVSFR